MRLTKTLVQMHSVSLVKTTVFTLLLALLLGCSHPAPISPAPPAPPSSVVKVHDGSTPNLSGSTNRVGETTFGNWQDGTTSTHQSIGGTTFHNFSNGRNCTSSRVGSNTFTNCN